MFPPHQAIFWKIDIEGHEVNAMRGALQLLGSASLKHVHFEWSRSMISAVGSKPRDAFDLLMKRGFSCMFEEEAAKTQPRLLVSPDDTVLNDVKVKANFYCRR